MNHNSSYPTTKTIMVAFSVKLMMAVVACAKLVSSSVHVEQTLQPDYIIVSARQRSGSSTLSAVIGGHPCAVNANEIWTDSPSQDILGAHQFTEMDVHEIRQYPHEFLTQVYGPLCDLSIDRGVVDSSCNRCTIVVKMFDIHSISPDGIKSLMADEGISFVVLERDVEQESCSLQLAHQKGDWGTTPDQHKLKADFECVTASEEFIVEHDKWFNFVRSELFNHGRYFINIPFNSVASCKLKNVAESIFAFGGLETPIELVYKDDHIQSLFTVC